MVPALVSWPLPVMLEAKITLPTRQPSYEYRLIVREWEQWAPQEGSLEAEQVVGRLAGLLALADLLARRVALGLLLFDGLDGRTAFDVERDGPLDERAEGIELAAAPHAVAERIGGVPHHPDVMHGTVP